MMVTNLLAYYVTEFIIAVINFVIRAHGQLFTQLITAVKSFIQQLLTHVWGVNFECGYVMRYALAVFRQNFWHFDELKI